ncbi:hypothetical protein [Herbaspirillum sp. RV1423]|uniref:hypothetical protein n=1 Tax=Herbaspirillum sp. RV1423 TaxID=1443993 RepID=UPI0012DDE194|nr:hypothetical protein [Herbaspirillum sp. RV1423]
MTIPSSFAFKPIAESRRRPRGRARNCEAARSPGSENQEGDNVEHYGPAGVGTPRVVMVFELRHGKLVEIGGSSVRLSTPKRICEAKRFDGLIWSAPMLGGLALGKAFAPAVMPGVLYAPSEEFVSHLAARVAELITSGGAQAPLAPAGEIDSLAAARARGRDSMRALLDASENLSLAEAANAARASQRHINALRKKHLLYALVLDGSNRGYRYPQWQFAADPRRLQPVLALLAARDLSCWAIHEFMCRRHPDLKLPPKDAILDSAVDIKNVLAAVDQRFSDADQGAA